MKTYDLIIIGYGAAGMMAAAQAQGLATLVLEKNPAAGRKVLISGKGQCNFTHDETASQMSAHFGQHKNFVKHALGKWTPQMTRDWFRDRGVDSLVMDNGKVFPKSLQAGDLVSVLVNEALDQGVSLHFKETATRIEQTVLQTGEAGFLVETDQSAYQAKVVLISTGGFTYAVTGSDGEGYKLAKALGHKLETPRPALTPIYHEVTWLKALAGVSIPEAKIGLKREGRVIGRYQGDLLFTHKGLSGPGILNNSRDFQAGDALLLSLTELSPEELEKKMLEMADKQGKSSVKAFLRQVCYSKSLADAAAEVLELDEKLSFSQINKTVRLKIVILLTQCEVPIEQIGGRQIAMVTAGGVELTEVVGRTMASKLIDGLYFAGEVLDVDGDTGGYNIQWAFSSAWLALSDIKAKA